MFPLYDHNPTRRTPYLTIALIVLNVVVHWRVTQLPPPQAVQFICQHGFISERLSRLDGPAPVTVQLPLDVNGDPRLPPQQVVVVTLPVTSSTVLPTFITMMFLHGGWLHLASNMWMLWVFGNNIEDRLGHFTYLTFYLVGGVLATLAQWVFDPMSSTPMVGASGAVAAALGGYALTYPWAKVRTIVFVGLPLLLDLPALVILGGWLVLETVMGVLAVRQGLEAGVAHWAHIGGFIAGVCIMPLLTIGIAPPGESWRKEAEDQFDYSRDPTRNRKQRLDENSPFRDFFDPRHLR